MKVTFKVHNEDITLEKIPNVLAINVPPNIRSSFVGEDNSKLGRLVREQELKEANIAIINEDVEAFKKSGYIFVYPNENTWRAFVEDRAIDNNIKSMGNVYIDSDGHIFIGTKLLTAKFKPDVSPDKIETFMKNHNLKIVHEFKFAPNTYKIQVPSGRDQFDITSEVSNDEKIVYVEPVLIQNLGRRAIPNDPQYKLQWQWNNDGSNGGLKNADVKAEEAWVHTKGEGIRVAVIDYGCYISHPDLYDNIVKEAAGFFVQDDIGMYSFVRGIDGFPSNPFTESHGTFCCGMIGALGDNNKFGCGIAYKAHLIPIACLGAGGIGDANTGRPGAQETLARSISYAANPQLENDKLSSDEGADVISCSLGPNSGGFVMFRILEDAISYAITKGRKSKGTPVFWAVSNNIREDGSRTDEPISIDKVCSNPNVIAVGRSTNKDTEDRTAFGPELDFLAPGVEVYSTLGDNFGPDTGTSYAAPLAAGIGALVLSVNNRLTWREVKQIMTDTCDKIGDIDYDETGHHPKYGYGRVNAAKAVKAAMSKN